MSIKNILIIILAALIILGFLFFQKKSSNTKNPLPNQSRTNMLSQNSNNLVQESNNTASNNQSNNANIANDNTNQSSASGFAAPLDRASERITKKPFGIFITPQTSPVQPERFSGYHTGTDFEIFPEELNADVPVNAVCDGKLLVARTASGYGGVAVQSCDLNSQPASPEQQRGEPITIVYGHLNISSVKLKVGDQIKAGDILGSLGSNKSAQTDGERKHLHLGIHKGSSVSILGYVQNKAELSGWIDPCSVDAVCK